MTTPQINAQLAVEALNRSDLAMAERLAHEALRQAPGDRHVLAVYGAVMNERGSYREAARAFRQLAAIEPGVAEHWMNLGTVLRSSGALKEARSAYESARACGAPSADLLFNLGMLQLDLSEPQAAQAALAEAARLAPADAEIGYQYARACFANVDTDATQAALADWRRWTGWTAELMGSVASLLLQMGSQADAEELVRRLDALPQRSAELEAQIVGMLERLNRVDEARARFEALTRGMPGPSKDPRLAVLRAQLAARAGDYETAATTYRELLVAPVAEGQRQQFLFPLAKALDAKGDHVQALEIAAQAHASQVAHLQQTQPVAWDEAREIMAITKYRCDPADVADWREASAPSAADSPVFIVAFPRSGTTLLEQMLDAHPGLQSMDEQPFLQKAVLAFADQGLAYPHALAQATPDQLSAIRRVYWELVQSKVRLRPGQRLLDKNPLNMLRLPAIVRLFPNAPILLAVRHPCDVVVSNYFQHYRAPEFVRLCRDLPTLALAWRKAFDFWYREAQVLRPRALEVRYEQFVADFDAQARAVAQFVELDWHEAMASPAEHARARGYISTPSYSQVVQPVNTRAVGKWRRYAAALEPVLAEVAPYLERWGYER